MNIMYEKVQKYVGGGQQRNKFRRNCLKNKNILFENQQIQIGSKITSIYDFYTSEYYIQVQIFIGNKTNRSMDSFKLDYRGTDNLSIWIQQKTRMVREKTQYKQRLIIQCKNFQEEILLLMDYQSQSLTLKCTPIPLSFISFCIFTPLQIPMNIPVQALKESLLSKNQYNEQCQIQTGGSVCKKGLSKDLPRFLSNLKPIGQTVLVGNFNIKTLGDQYTIIFEIYQQVKLVATLYANQYFYFDVFFSNLKYLLSP